MGNHIPEKAAGSRIILNSCRTGEALEKAVQFCKENGLEFDRVNENLPELIEAYGEDSRKISADYYIDDKAISSEMLNKELAVRYGILNSIEPYITYKKKMLHKNDAE